jgi:hypothetical protein
VRFLKHDVTPRSISTVWPFFGRRPRTRLSQPWRLSTSSNLIFIAEGSGGLRLLAELAAAEATDRFVCVLRGNPSLDIETPAGSPRYGPAPGPSSGCGTGEHAVMAANLGLEAIDMDTAGTAIAVAKAQSSGARPPIPGFRCASPGVARRAFRRHPSTADCFRFSETRIAVRSKKTSLQPFGQVDAT